MFRNIILFIVLVSGLVAGYFVGSYKGREAIEALEKEKATMAALEKERAAIEANLKKDIASIEEKRTSELANARTEFEARSTQWEKSKASLDATIKKQNALLADTDRQIDALVNRIKTATGPEKNKLEQQLAKLREDRTALQKEVDGTQCLKVVAPPNVIQALGN